MEPESEEPSTSRSLLSAAERPEGQQGSDKSYVDEHPDHQRDDNEGKGPSRRSLSFVGFAPPVPHVRSPTEEDGDEPERKEEQRGSHDRPDEPRPRLLDRLAHAGRLVVTHVSNPRPRRTFPDPGGQKTVGFAAI